MTFSALRRALVIQGVSLLAAVTAVLATAIEGLVHPPVCSDWCLNVGPVFLIMGSTPFVPPLIVLALLAWRWRGKSLWPAGVLVVTDVVIVVVAVGILRAYPMEWPEPVPAIGLLPVVVILPALATTVLAVDQVRPIPWRPVIAAGALACVVLGGLIAFNVVGPLHQDIPGQLSLPFSAAVVYKDRDLGCHDYDAGWTHQHVCLNSALVVYRGSGDPGADQLTIDRAVEDRTRLSPTEGKVEPLPVDAPFGQSYLSTMDYRQAGGCLLIIDRSSTPPAGQTFGHCATAGDYEDVRGHWPASDPYAIGIVYWYTRPG